MEVSIIIPTKGRLPLLKEAVASCFVQQETFKGRFEVLVIDDADDAALAQEAERKESEAMQAWVQAQPSNVVYLRAAQHSSKSGAPAARNLGMQQARGAYIKFLDSDDVLAPGVLAAQVAALNAPENAEAACAHGGFEMFGNLADTRVGGQPVRPMGPMQINGEENPVAVLLTDWWVPPFAYLWHKALLEKAGIRWQEDLPCLQDFQFALHAAALGLRFVYVPGLCGRYRIHGGQITQTAAPKYARIRLHLLQELEAVLQKKAPHLLSSPPVRSGLAHGYFNAARALWGVNTVLCAHALQRMRSVQRGFVPVHSASAPERLVVRALGVRASFKLRACIQNIKKIFKRAQPKMLDVCIVTTRHVSYNPRVVKEADALSAAGLRVGVVALSANKAQAVLDVGLMLQPTRSWALHTVNMQRGSFAWVRYTCVEKLCGMLSRVNICMGIPGIAPRAQFGGHSALKRLAHGMPAKVYSAHHPEALAAAHSAAAKYSAQLVFDCEDFHSGQFSPAQQASPAARCTHFLEARYLPRCTFITLASPCFEAPLRQLYAPLQLPPMHSILNVFGLEEREQANPALSEGACMETKAKNKNGVEGGAASPVQLYWYSQVVGPGRGLENLWQALALLQQTLQAGKVNEAVSEGEGASPPWQLSVRGCLHTCSEFVSQLKNQAEAAGFAQYIQFLEPVPPAELIAQAAQYHIGLALEVVDVAGAQQNRDLCITNKLCAYTLAGLATVATQTQGQQWYLQQCPGSGTLVPQHNPEALAGAIHRYITAPAGLKDAQAAALNYAKTAFNWQAQSVKLVSLYQNL